MRRAVPPRLPLASQRLIVITGKGGVGKTTVTAAFAQAAAAARRRVLAVEVGPGRLGTLLGAATVSHEPTRVGPRLAVACLEPEAVLGDFVLSALRLRLLARRLLESTTFQVLAAAAPGLPELLVLHRVAGWLEERRLGRPAYDLVLLDAPASGHSLPLLRFTPTDVAALAALDPNDPHVIAARFHLERRRQAQAQYATLRRTLGVSPVRLPLLFPPPETSGGIDDLATGLARAAGFAA